MDKRLKLLRETYNLIEGSTGVNLIIVDIQPEYEEYMGFDTYQFTEWLNENSNNFNSITYLYNGAETLDMIEEHDLKFWLYENELNEDLLNNISFYDKGYAFFRYCIDSGISDEDIALLVRYMYKNDINDSRDIDEEVWEAFVAEYGLEEVKELLQYAGDMINIPELMEILVEIDDKIALVGGGINECLKEVEIALTALGKEYKLISDWTY